MTFEEAVKLQAEHPDQYEVRVTYMLQPMYTYKPLLIVPCVLCSTPLVNGECTNKQCEACT